MQRAGRIALAVLGTAVGLVFLKEMLGHYGTGGGSPGDRWLHPTASLPAAIGGGPRPSPADSVTVTVHAQTQPGDSLFTVDLVIANQSGSAVTDIAMQCDAIGANGAATGHVGAVLNDTVAGHATRTRSKLELHFIHRPVGARCAVTGFTVVR